MSFSFEEFGQIVNQDFQRSNMFSVVFATTPLSRADQLMSQYSNISYVDELSSTEFSWARPERKQSLIDRLGIKLPRLSKQSNSTQVSKYLIGAMTERVVQSLLGEFSVGTNLLEFFDMNNTKDSGLLAYAVKLPENRLNHEMDITHNAPSVKIIGREFDVLTISFRMAPDALNYIAFNDWVNSVEDPVTGLKALPVDVEADIQVNLHNRRGLPHTTAMLSGCIPISVGSPDLSYENDNQITTFDVTFAYRTMQIGQIKQADAEAWVATGGFNPFETPNRLTI